MTHVPAMRPLLLFRTRASIRHSPCPSFVYQLGAVFRLEVRDTRRRQGSDASKAIGHGESIVGRAYAR